jgi:hypothetical protein
MYQAGTAEEMIPLENDFDRVRRSRETGLRGLGQPLKSIRDARVDYTVYQPGSPARAWLDTLGPVEKPTRGSRVGLNPHRTWRNGDPSSELQQEMDLQKTALASELASTGKSASQS